MVGSGENWSPGGPDGNPDAADPSACLMRDKAGEGKAAKSTEEKDMYKNLTINEDIKGLMWIKIPSECPLTIPHTKQELQSEYHVPYQHVTEVV